MKVRLSPPLLVLAILASIQPMAAQTITGRVADSETATSVGRGFVIALDTLGNEVARTLAAADGTFELRLPDSGTYRLRSERIAYRPAETGFFTVGAGEAVNVDMDIQAIPVTLAAIEVEEESQCRINPEEGARTAVLWEEIRKALDGAIWTGAQRGFRYRFLQYERHLDTRARRVIVERTDDRVGSYRTPFRTREAQWLADSGFVVDDRQNMWFYAPDTEVLQHDAFLSTHCFRVVRDNDRENMVGLEFRPADGRNLPDVTGVLWLNESTAELRTLEFSYTELPGRIRDDRIGGTVEFLQLPNGAWIVREWVIRLPVLGLDDNLADPTRRGGVAVRGYQDTGGEVVTVSTTQRDTVYMAPVAELAGVVSDGANMLPLRGAVVQLVGTNYSSVTNALGEYRISAFVNGAYGVTFVHPRADSLGYTPQEVEVTLQRGDAATLDLTLPTSAVIFEHLCGEPPRRGARAIFGRVTSANRPVSGATVNVVWQQGVGEILEALANDAVSVRSTAASTTTNEEGKYMACGVPSDRLMMVAASTDSTWSRPTTIRFDTLGVWYQPEPCMDQTPNEMMRSVASDGFDPRARVRCMRTQELAVTNDLLWRQDLVISNSLAPNTVLLSGAVLDAESGMPIEGATVTVEPASLHVPVEAGGTFEVPVVWRDDLTLVVTSQGYATLRYSVESRGGRMIELPTDALMLRANEERRTRTGAEIITKAEIEEAEAATAADAVRRIHSDWLRGTRGTVRFSGDAPIVVYVNNARWGGTEVLESVSAQTIREIRFYQPRDATTRFGTGHAGGVIQIIIMQ